MGSWLPKSVIFQCNCIGLHFVIKTVYDWYQNCWAFITSTWSSYAVLETMKVMLKADLSQCFKLHLNSKLPNLHVKTDAFYRCYNNSSVGNSYVIRFIFAAEKIRVKFNSVLWNQQHIFAGFHGLQLFLKLYFSYLWGIISMTKTS